MRRRMEQLPLPFGDAPAQPADAEQSAAPQRRKRLVIDERQATPKRARSISDACVTTTKR